MRTLILHSGLGRGFPQEKQVKNNKTKIKQYAQHEELLLQRKVTDSRCCQQNTSRRRYLQLLSCILI